MKLYIVRHAVAIERSSHFPDDKRYLTPEGRVAFRKIARKVKKKGITPDYILTSPLLRSVQTADILAEAIAFKGPLTVADELAPGFKRKELAKLLTDCSPAKELVLVGHEPDLSSLIVSLLGLDGDFTLKKGAVVALKLDVAEADSPANFKWMAAGKKLITSLDEVTGK